VDSWILGGLIHTPNDKSYAAAIIAVFGIGGFSFTSELLSRSNLCRRVGLWRIYSAILVTTALWSIVVFGSQYLFATSACRMLAAIFFGVTIGLLSIYCDRQIVRFFSHRPFTKGLRKRDASGVAARPYRDTSSVSSVAPGGPAMEKSQAADRHVAHPINVLYVESIASFTWIDAVLVATSEELVYRWCLVRVAFLFSIVALTGLWLLMITLLFALSHVWLGWQHVYAKLPLGIAMMVGVLIFGNVLPALIGHILFNLRTQQERSRYGL
jgi:Type II CAAX prenyl endopeptidase Rce1-like